ncbi:MAG: VWA domain-containing protein [Chloroflexota bacterium]
MDFLWPGFLWILGVIPLLAAVYVWILRRRRRFAVRYSSLSLVRAALPDRSRWRRHFPFALFLLGLSSLVLAFGRPVAVVTVPVGKTTVILAIDVSRSMCSTDIQPSRLDAAKSAAIAFIQRQSPNTQIGVLAFGGFAELVQPPTTDQEVLEDAVWSLIIGRRTAIGSGILGGLDAIAEVDQGVAPSDGSPAAPAVPPTPVPDGAYVPHIIVLLTDGVSNVGIAPLDAAEQAVARGVRVYTIGFGTDHNDSFPNCGRQNQPGASFNDPFFGPGWGSGGGGGFSGGFRRNIDEETLIRIAEMTGGEYYSATSAGELQTVFEELPVHLVTRHEVMDISVIFTALGAALALAAILLAMSWNPLP